MQQLHTDVRAEINASKEDSARIPDLEQYAEGLQLLDRVGRDHMRKFISYFGIQGSRCGRCGESPGTMGGKHGTKGVGLLLDCPLSRIYCPFCKTVFNSVPDVDTQIADGPGDNLHPTGYHVKQVCPYMKAKFQLYLAHTIIGMANLRPRAKAFVPFGGSAVATNLASSAPPARPQPNFNQDFADSLDLF